MTHTDEAMDFLMTSGGGAPTAKFPEIGTVHKGRILSMERKQQTDFLSKKPLFWDNGDPRWELVITLQTDERDDETEDDDGQRRIFAKGKLMYAIREAVEASGFRGSSLVGGNLAVKYTGNGKASQPGMSPPKEYAAKFEPPAAVDDLGDYDEESF